mmetsp:Transcript_39367/g.78692  ORF Transcript_39367/g.78692 Transcript_39367/m.78692 type:complete len:234 (+) Transcript_39367:225-926(+)
MASALADALAGAFIRALVQEEVSAAHHVTRARRVTREQRDVRVVVRGPLLTVGQPRYACIVAGPALLTVVGDESAQPVLSAAMGRSGGAAALSARHLGLGSSAQLTALLAVSKIGLQPKASVDGQRRAQLGGGPGCGVTVEALQVQEEGGWQWVEQPLGRYSGLTAAPLAPPLARLIFEEARDEIHHPQRLATTARTAVRRLVVRLIACITATTGGGSRAARGAVPWSAGGTV